MSATKTGNYMNWANVSVTPQGGAAIAITEVTDVSPDLDSTQEMFYGDNRRFPKLIRSTEYKREISITTGNVGLANTVPVDQPCTITATFCDARNGTGTGAITYTLVNAVMKSNKAKGQNNKFGEVTLMFAAYGNDANGTDGDPFSYVVA